MLFYSGVLISQRGLLFIGALVLVFMWDQLHIMRDMRHLCEFIVITSVLIDTTEDQFIYKETIQPIGSHLFIGSANVSFTEDS